jgi:hypothetical protein
MARVAVSVGKTMQVYLAEGTKIAADTAHLCYNDNGLNQNNP